jgi:hypothetical protein
MNDHPDRRADAAADRIPADASIVGGLARFLLIIAAGVRDFGVAFLELVEARQGHV